MGKTKIVFMYLLFPLLILSNIDSYSQKLFNKPIIWTNQDSIETVTFNDTNQIINWGKNQLDFSTVRTKDVVINNTNIFIVLTSGCSGLPCWNIGVFRKTESTWHLTAKADLVFNDLIKVEVDFCQKKILFITKKSGQIGELPFDVLE